MLSTIAYFYQLLGETVKRGNFYTIIFEECTKLAITAP